MNKLKFYLYSGVGIIGAAAMAGLVLWKACGTVPEAKRTIGVQASAEYQEATQAAVDVWNGFVGCRFLVDGDDVLVKADDGAPCGDPWRPAAEWDHAATAYRCPTGKSEVLVSRPGNINTQACIIAHEIGHTLAAFGVVHATIGIMSDGCASDAQNYLRIRDRDVDALRAEFCR